MLRILAKIAMKGELLTGRPKETVRREQLSAMHEATQFTARQVKSRTPQGVFGAKGGLLATIQPEVRETTRGVLGIVGTASPYGLVAEKGRRPGKGRPPEGVLLRWIEVKLGVSAEEAKEIEPAMRWSIAHKGTKGAHMFEKTLDEDWGDIRAIFERHGVAIARELST